MALGIISALLPLAILVGVIALIVALVRRRGASREGRAVALRRAFTYSLAFVSLAASGVGVTLLVFAILESFFGGDVVSTDNDILALGLALTIVGAPIWLLFWAAIQRTTRREPLEVQSLGRRVHFALVMASSAITAAIGAVQVLRWALGGSDFSSASAAALLVWGAVWAFYWLIERREGPFEEDAAAVQRLYVYGMSLFGVALLAVAVDGLLQLTLSAAYNGLFGARDPLLREFALWDGVIQPALANGIVGGIGWWWHWKVMASDRTPLIRQVYLYLFTILGGAVTVVAALSVGLYHILQWYLGTPETTSALAHFDVFPGIIAAVAVGGALWVYHWTVVREEARTTEGLGPAQRAYGYLVAAVGLVVLGVGITMLLATAFGLIAPPSTFIEFDWRDPILLAVTLLSVGAPIWGGYWRDVQQKAVAGGQGERAAMSRRVFIYLIFGLSVLLTLINLSIVLFRVFDALLGGGAGNVLWDMRWSLGILFAAGSASGYYWAVLSEDRRAAAKEEAAREEGAIPGPAPAQKTVIVLAGTADAPVVRRLEEALGYEVQAWERAAQGQSPAVLSDDALAEAVRAVGQSPSEEVMLLVNAGGVEVVPYRRLPTLP
ncbi:MAG: hypothetical protein HY681_15170 [Chloroflexi bacterium]|nr:hypothetical protein [Chloroflexota bacterium]